MSVLTIASLAKSYRAGVPGCSGFVSVLRNVQLELSAFEIVALTGPPRCGKSTLLRCAAGLLRPDAGSVHWFGTTRARYGRVAYVCADVAPPTCGQLPRPRVADGTLYARLQLALARGARVLLIDDLATVSRLECRLALALLRDHAGVGVSAMFSANDALAAEPLVTRVATLERGELVQRRNRSATRIADSSFAARARASARSTYGRSLRSPQ